MQKFIDPSTQRKGEIVAEKLALIDGFPVFSIVEFNIFGNCNRNCSFCPVSDDGFYKKTKDAISIELYSKIMDDLVQIDFNGKILYSAFCEPLLHKEVEKLIHITREKLPSVRIEIVTNGDLLTSNKLKRLFEAGLNTASISMYDGEHQIVHFTDMRDACGLDESQIVLRRRYFDGENYGITISNRVGLVDSNQYRDKNEQKVVKFPLMENCFYPFYMTLIDHNGDMLLCPHDWRKTTKIGNLTTESIWELWTNSPKLQGIRGRLSNDDREFTPCATCDVIGKVMGEESYNRWVGAKGI